MGRGMKITEIRGYKLERERGSTKTCSNYIEKNYPVSNQFTPNHPQIWKLKMTHNL